MKVIFLCKKGTLMRILRRCMKTSGSAVGKDRVIKERGKIDDYVPFGHVDGHYSERIGSCNLLIFSHSLKII